MTRIIILAIFFACIGCMKTEVLNAPAEKEAVVEKRKKPEKPMPEKPEQADTTRKPIEFNPSVNDWDEQDINL